MLGLWGAGAAPHEWGHWIGTGTAAGTVAAAVGVGGGVVLVPAYHRWLGLSMHRSVGTSSATIVLISGLSAIAYVALGVGEAGRGGGTGRRCAGALI